MPPEPGLVLVSHLLADRENGGELFVQIGLSVRPHNEDSLPHNSGGVHEVDTKYCVQY